MKPKDMPYNEGATTAYLRRIVKHGGMKAWRDRYFRLLKRQGHPVLTTR